MQPRKLDVMISRFPYGGNGGTASEVPDIGDWLVETVLAMKEDPRVGEIYRARKSDTPITMTRNAVIEGARRAKADVLVMVDSDMFPDYELSRGDPAARPFWKSSFDFLYEHWEKGPLMIGAPYCGPPPFENVYVFQWADVASDNPHPQFRLEAYTREQAALLGGIRECGALPTGLILFDMRLFDTVQPPYFEYEWVGDGPPCPACGCPKPGPRHSKASTEDVVTTRDISLNATIKLGYNPTFSNWDAWAGHWKPKCVGKPRKPNADMVGRQLTQAVLEGRRAGEQERVFEPPPPVKVSAEVEAQRKKAIEAGSHMLKNHRDLRVPSNLLNAQPTEH